MNWVYKKTHPDLWTVGFYEPDGKWEAESDHNKAEDAAKRTHYLNGGKSDDRVKAAAPELLAACKMFLNWNDRYHGDDPSIEEETLFTVTEEMEAAIAKAEGRAA